MERTSQSLQLPVGNGSQPAYKYKPGSLDRAQYDAIVALIEKYPKQSGRALAHRLGVSKNVVYRLLRKFDLKTGFNKRPPRRKTKVTEMHAAFIGQRCGKLLVTGARVTSKPYRQWLEVRCDCGVEKTVHLEKIKRQETKSCGCAQYKRSKKC